MLCSGWSRRSAATSKVTIKRTSPPWLPRAADMPATALPAGAGGAVRICSCFRLSCYARAPPQTSPPSGQNANSAALLLKINRSPPGALSEFSQCPSAVSPPGSWPDDREVLLRGLGPRLAAVTSHQNGKVEGVRSRPSPMAPTRRRIRTLPTRHWWEMFGSRRTARP